MHRINNSKNRHFGPLAVMLLLTLVFELIISSAFSQTNNGTSTSDNGPEKSWFKANGFFQNDKYDSSVIFYKKAYNSFVVGKNWEKSIKCLISIAQSFQIVGLNDSSYFYIDSAEKLFGENRVIPMKLLADILFIKGNLLSKSGNIDSAYTLLNQSYDICIREESDSLQTHILKSLGNLKLMSKENEAALDLYEKALAIEEKRSHSSDVTIASIYTNLGIVYSNLGVYDSAKNYFNKSLLLKEKYLIKNDPQLASGYLNFGRFLFIIGETEESMEYLNKAEEIYISKFGISYFGLAPIYTNKGSIFIFLGDFGKALTYHEMALDLYKKNGMSSNAAMYDLYLNFGVIYEKMSDLKKAIEFYDFCQKDNSNNENLIKALRNSARCYYALQDYQKSEENYKKAVSLSERLFGKDDNVTAGSYNSYGEFLSLRSKYDQAISLFNQSLKIYQNHFGEKHNEVALVLVNLADLYYSKSDIQTALNYYQKAIISDTKDFNDKNIFSNPGVETIDAEFNILVLLYKKSVALFDYYQKENYNVNILRVAFESNSLAIQVFEKILSSYKDESTKILVNDYVYEIYNSIVLIVSELYSLTSDQKYLNYAFEFSEKGKAAVLLSTLRQSEALQIGKIPESIKKKEQTLNSEISFYRNNVYDENQKPKPDNNKILALKNILFQKTLSYDSLITNIENNFPEYYKLKYSVNVCQISDIQKHLTSTDAFIEYKIVDSALLTFFITIDKVKFKKQILKEDISDKVVQFLSMINEFPSRDFTKKSYSDFINQSYYLYKVLLDSLSDLDQHSNLIIVPDGILGYLNFESLLMDDHVPDKLDFKSINYVINKFSVSYINSATIMFEKRYEKNNKRQLLAMAPTYSNEGERFQNQDLALREKLNMLRPLDYSVEEVNNVSSIISGDVLTGKDATEKHFKENAHKYGILHFAMHTLIDEEDPLNSKLVFTLDNDSSEDGLLNNYEIYNLNLNAKLAVLSACKTGIGKISKGEGIMSLARGFMYAGVPSIVMTLWEIEDNSSATIMDKFYRGLKEGNSISDALRNSKLSYLNESDQLHSHPYFWAAYVQIGDKSSIINYSKAKFYLYFIAGFLVLVVVLFLWIKYRKRNSFN
jgi:CHAT domain-containing protein/Tfp pilus assembly protein PilF